MAPRTSSEPIVTVERRQRRPVAPNCGGGAWAELAVLTPFRSCSTQYNMGDGGRMLEHSLIFALIEIADPAATARGLTSDNSHVRRAALIALDQMPKGNLRSERRDAPATLPRSPAPRNRELDRRPSRGLGKRAGRVFQGATCDGQPCRRKRLLTFNPNSPPWRRTVQSKT